MPDSIAVSFSPKKFFQYPYMQNKKTKKALLANPVGSGEASPRKVVLNSELYVAWNQPTLLPVITVWVVKKATANVTITTPGKKEIMKRFWMSLTQQITAKDKLRALKLATG